MQNTWIRRTIDSSTYGRFNLPEEPLPSAAPKLSPRSESVLSALVRAGLITAWATGTLTFTGEEHQHWIGPVQPFLNALMGVPEDSLPLLLVAVDSFAQEHPKVSLMRATLMDSYAPASGVLQACCTTPTGTWRLMDPHKLKVAVAVLTMRLNGDTP